MSFKRHLVAAAALLLASACGSNPLSIPQFLDDGMLKEALPLPASSFAALAGIYDVGGATNYFGTQVAISTAQNKLSIFSSLGTYSIVRAGCLKNGTQLVLEGYWRLARNYGIGLTRLMIGPDSAVSALCSGADPGHPIFKLSGAIGKSSADPSIAVDFTYNRALVDVSAKFNVIAHHGVCRTIDECGYSENSVESLRNVEVFGANMAEIDVRLTADGVPIVFHDVNFTDRLTSGQYCHGNLSELPLSFIRSHCTLKYGEQVPTLEEMLASAINDTGIKALWLDMKIPEAIAASVPVIAKANALAKSKGRTFSAIIGLPDPETIAAFAANAPSGSPCLIEDNVADLAKNGCKYWGPRFTEGSFLELVKDTQAQGDSVYFWTIDDTVLMDFYLKFVHPNGIITDRPGLLFHRAQANAAITGGN